MNYIKSLTIDGLKKFEHFDIEFDKNINIIIGENEAGKSTILEAINICLNQLYRNSDKSIIKDLLNINNVKKFEKNPSIETLPKIQIEIEFNLDNDSKNNFLFYGMHNKEEKEKYGIKYTCELNREFEQESFEFIKEGKVPYEYIEEPENHLSHTNLRQMLKNIENYKEDKQIIITTHSNLIVSGLNIKNIIWINKDKSQKLKDIDKDIAEFFIRSDNNNLLQFLLAKKVILVEGATEYILIPKIFEKMFNQKVEENNIDVISCNGVTYKNFIHIAKLMNKKVSVITDNDNSQEKIDEMNSYNKQHDNIKIFMDNDIQNWTWEVCFYNLNSDKLSNLIEIKENAKYLYKEKDYGQILGKMLNNKAETAYKICMSNEKFQYPLYVEEALKWIKG